MERTGNEPGTERAVHLQPADRGPNLGAEPQLVVQGHNGALHRDSAVADVDHVLPARDLRDGHSDRPDNGRGHPRTDHDHLKLYHHTFLDDNDYGHRDNNAYLTNSNDHPNIYSNIHSADDEHHDRHYSVNTDFHIEFN